MPNLPDTSEATFQQLVQSGSTTGPTAGEPVPPGFKKRHSRIEIVQLPRDFHHAPTARLPTPPRGSPSARTAAVGNWDLPSGSPSSEIGIRQPRSVLPETSENPTATASAVPPILVRNPDLGVANPGVSVSDSALVRLLDQIRQLQDPVVRSDLQGLADQAAQGDPVGQIRISDEYRFGDRLAPDPDLAFQWCRRAAGQKDSYAQRVLAWMYYEGQGVESNRSLSREWLSKAAEQNDPEAQLELGDLYYQDQEYKEAFHWYEQAAQKGIGSAEAMYMLGLCYENGQGVDSKPVEALTWYQRAAQLGSLEASQTLGRIYHHGQLNQSTDPKEAFRWYHTAAELKNPEAMSMIGSYYEKGSGVELNSQQALGWYRKAAEAGDGWSANRLGRIYHQGQLGQNPDPPKALRWYQEAAKLGDLEGIYNLAGVHKDGQLGQPKDRARALQLYAQAARLGHPKSMTMAGLVYDNGQGSDVQADVQKAITWLTAAVEIGQSFEGGWAAYALGQIYRFGRPGLDKNLPQAVEWYRRAADFKHPQALTMLGWLYEEGLGVKHSDEEALKWYQQGAAAKDNWAADQLGQVYELGKFGQEKDRVQALQWYTQAAEHKDLEGVYHLGRLLSQGTSMELAQGLQRLYQAVQKGHLGAQILLLSQDPARISQDPELEAWYAKAIQNPVRQLELAQAYQSGHHGLGVDPAEAVRWCMKAADQGDAKAQTQLASWYRTGQGLPVSSELAFQWSKKAAIQGYAAAQTFLGYLHASGLGTPVNVKEAAQWYQRAAIQGDYNAKYNLGEMYRDQIGVPRNYLVTIQSYQQAALGPEASMVQADLYQLYQDRAEELHDPGGFQHYEPLAQQGQAPAQVLVGLMYQSGVGRPRNLEQAQYWFDRASRQQAPWGQVCLALLYLQGAERFRNVSHGWELLNQAAQQNYAWAQRLLAQRYRQGQDVEVDEKQAVQLYEQAVEQDDAWSKMELGEMYEYGQGVESDVSKAAELYRGAAEQWLAPAQYKLAQIYELGRGVPRNLIEAEKWYLMAAERGILEAQQKLGDKYLQYIEDTKKDLLTPQQLSQDWLHLEKFVQKDISLDLGTLRLRRLKDLEALHSYLSHLPRVFSAGITYLSNSQVSNPSQIILLYSDHQYSHPERMGDHLSVKSTGLGCQCDPPNNEHVELIILHNQYIVEGLDSPFSEIGDSGALCYLLDEGSNTIRPLGLLHSGIEKSFYSIITPLEAVMDFLGDYKILGVAE